MSGIFRSLLCVACSLAGISSQVVAAGPPEATFQHLEQQFRDEFSPLLRQYCYSCHSDDRIEAEIDFKTFSSLDDLRRDVQVWQRTRTMLDSEQMPPIESRQPSENQLAKMRSWVNGFLKAEAQSRAGDPGRIVLRRLSNAEYTYTIRDLTGIDTLDPTNEFPVDGAAGEGFTNVGDGLVMSPSLVTKYLDAAKEIARHTVLLPDGIVFSPYTTERDWTNQWLAKIQSIYRQSTDDSGSTRVKLPGIQFDAKQGGNLPVEKYLAATLRQRKPLSSGEATIDDVARAHRLRSKYLGLLWHRLSAQQPDENVLLESLRRKWKSASPNDAPQLASEIKRWQDSLWKFNAIGHMGRATAPKSWMQPVSPIVSSQQLRLPLSESDEQESTFYLTVGDAGDGNAGDYVLLKNMKLEAPNRPPLLVRDAAGIAKRIAEVRREMLARTSQYLAAAAETLESDAADAAQKHRVDRALLRVWLNYLMIDGGTVPVQNHFTEKLSTNYDFVRGWGSHQTPSILANSSDQEVRIPGQSKPHSVTVHPSPTLFSAVGWRSPVDGPIKIEAKVADAHDACGNGAQWLLQRKGVGSVRNLWQGEYERGGREAKSIDKLFVRAGELVSLIVGPRQSEHTCDLTHIDLVISEVGGQGRVWDLADDVSSDIQASNPHPDHHGNDDTWHFYHGEVAGLQRSSNSTSRVPPGSLLDRWDSEKDPRVKEKLAVEVQQLVSAVEPEESGSADAELYRQLHSLPIPLNHPFLKQGLETDDRFGRHPVGDKIASADMVVRSPAVVEFRLDAQIASSREVVVDVELAQAHGNEGSVQTSLHARLPVDWQILRPTLPLLIASDSQARRRWDRVLDEFRNLFPPALCYDRIVPVDEVVTLLLFYREDQHLQRLMLDENEIEQLNRLWDELYYISREPLKLVVSHEQLYEFSTQDRPDYVKEFAPLREPLKKRAEVFRQKMLKAQPRHIDAVLEFAARAWRRPLGDDQRDTLLRLYDDLRREEMNHEEAIRLVIARILTSPAFLYRHEVPKPGRQQGPVSDWELASRLSYFLWSSMPDEALLAAAEKGELSSEEVLDEQAMRMLQDARSRRLAEQFACQWLHVRDFDHNEEKNEKLYPEFADLRTAMYQETLRFFEDMFRHDRSILTMLDADHTFLNETLAGHYGIDGIEGPRWRRVEGVSNHGRGGVLAMATVLSSQSGASRTSPILRGNWIYETLLGQRLPRPPADVPQLPDEKPVGLTARQLIEQHSRQPGCAKCHDKIDPFGFSLERYDAIGRLRSEPIDTKTRLPDGQTIDGIDGLRHYLMNTRRNDVVKQFCRKLLGYALGRQVLLSDEPLLDLMQQNLEAGGYRFSHAVKTIVNSRQFREIRGRELSRIEYDQLVPLGIHFREQR